MGNTMIEVKGLVKKFANLVAVDNVSFTLEKGDVVRIVGCDDVAWCEVRDSQGTAGWFQVRDFDTVVSLNIRAAEVFDGLSYAD